MDLRAWFGYTAAGGSTDDGRFRLLTVHLPAAYAQQLLDAQGQGAGEAALRGIVAEGLQEVYFKDGGHRAHGLEVDLTPVPPSGCNGPYRAAGTDVQVFRRSRANSLLLRMMITRWGNILEHPCLTRRP
ncbi:hypothetical protein ABZ490_29265 [Streptomyces sp. NPDC005811]|uniref:telomere-protecting terminal protein Tpg n=1 Tax=Streptomyces sp. NPDC005811 TaxID=3154565 RepID=UPI0033F2B6FF